MSVEKTHTYTSIIFWFRGFLRNELLYFSWLPHGFIPYLYLIILIYIPTRASIEADGSSSSSICMDVTTFPPSFIRLTINGLRTGFDHCCCCSWICTASKRLLWVGVDGWLGFGVEDETGFERWFNGEWWPLLVTLPFFLF